MTPSPISAVYVTCISSKLIDAWYTCYHFVVILCVLAPEVVDPQIANRILAMFMAYYCNIGDGINDERQTDGILQTLLSQLKDHKGNLASITTGTTLSECF